jgi:hypothetical protein
VIPTEAGIERTKRAKHGNSITTPVKKECKIQHFVEGFEVAEDHSLMAIKSVPRCRSDQVSLISECQVSRESDANQNLLLLKTQKTSCISLPTAYY